MDKDITTTKTLLLGKVEYNNTGRADCPVELEIELRTRTAPIITKSVNPDDVGKPSPFETTDHRELMEYVELSVTGSVWMPNRRDIYSGGQNIDEIAAMFPNDARVRRIAEIWREWHLNGMTQGCVHQGEAWICTNHPGNYANEINRLKSELAALYEDHAPSGKIATAEFHIKWAEEVQALAHAGNVPNGPEETEQRRALNYPAPPHISRVGGQLITNKSYGFDAHTCGVCGRARWDEPSDYCPETGYRYGSSWLVRVMPPEIEAEIRALMQD